MPSRLVDSTLRSQRYWHVTFWLGAVVASYWILRALAPVLTPVLAAAGIAYLLDPLVERLTRRRLSRGAAAGIVLLGFAVVFLGVVAVLVPLIARDLGDFATRLPALATAASQRVAGWLGVDVPANWGGMVDELRASLGDAARTAGVPLLTGLARALSGIAAFLAALVNLLLVPMFAFYFLADWPRMLERVHSLVPPRHDAALTEILHEIDARVSHWVRGQLTAMLCSATLYAIALSIVGIPLAIPIGLLAGFLSVIPYVGNLVGLVLALTMGVVEWDGVVRLVAIGAVFGVMNLIEGFVLTPLLVGAKVGLSEAGALFAVLAGGHLFGFVGLLLAIPLAASADVLLRRTIRYYRGSTFYAPATE